MIIGDRDIRTPFISMGDDPLNAACNWPQQVAVAMRDKRIAPSRMPKIIRDCPEYGMICKHAEFLKALESSEVAARKKYNLHYIADGWFTRRNESPARDYVDPLLLGGTPHSVTAALCGREFLAQDCPAELINVYEKMFYRCLDDDGRVSSPIRNRILALNGCPSLHPSAPEQDKWKAVAAIFDYSALVEYWGFWSVEMPAGLSDEVRFDRQKRYGQGHMFQRMIAGQVDDEYSLEWVGQSIAHERQQYDMGAGASENVWAELFGRVLQLSAPTLAPVRQTQDDIERQNAALRNKLEAEKNVRAIDVPDAGPAAGHAARNKQIRKHLASEAARQETPQQ